MESRLPRYHKGMEGFYTVQKIEPKSRKVISESVEPNRPMRAKWAGEKRSAPGRAVREQVRKARTMAAAGLRRAMSKLRRKQQATQRRREKRGWL